MKLLEQHASMCLLMRRGAQGGWNTSSVWDTLDRLKDEMTPDDRRIAELQERVLTSCVFLPQKQEGANP